MSMLAISADSRQIYCHMNIGTGKPTPADMKILPHAGVNLLDPVIIFSVYQYFTIAAAGLAQAREERRQAWFCGGTGLYIRAIVEGLKLAAPPRPQLRAALERLILERGAERVAIELKIAVKDPSNPVRVIRAAENACSDAHAAGVTYEYCGLASATALTDVVQQPGQPEALPGELAQWRCGGIAVLDPGNEVLAGLIEQRVTGMFQHGLLEEVQELRRLGFGTAPVVAQGIAYAEAAAVLDGRLGLDEAVALAITRTKQYAKRQRTYFRGRGWPFFNPEQLDEWAAERVKVMSMC